MNEKFFRINDRLTIHCRSEKTRSGFRHLASLFENGLITIGAKVCYLNRTWERYEFQSVIQELGRKAGGETGTLIADFADKYQEDDSSFRLIGAIAAMGSILTENQKEANDWKARMLKAGLPALDIPDDWDQLTEEEKERRLDAVIGVLAE
jgi:hypothetical protein